MLPPLSPLHLPVRTESGKSLGLVVDVLIETDTQSVVAYHVKPSRLLPDVLVAPLVIHRTQVIHITEESVIVDDATLKNPKPTTAPQALA